MQSITQQLEQRTADPVDELAIDRTAFTIVALDADSDEANDERTYWWSRTPQERMNHLEYLRSVNYGDQVSERLQRILEVVEFQPG